VPPQGGEAAATAPAAKGSQGGGSFGAFGGTSRKLCFILLYSVGEFTGTIKSNSFDPRALGHLRTFMMTPPMPHKSLKSRLGQIYLIWQEFESITSPTFIFLKLLPYPYETRVHRSHNSLE
jgi:hypothetical protein